MKALVVDDSVVSRRILFGILQHSCDIEDVKQVSDGVEALELIKEDDFGLILLDWNMPEMQGIDVLREVRGRGREGADHLPAAVGWSSAVGGDPRDGGAR